MAMPKKIVAQRLFDFASVIGDRHLINATVGPRLDPIVLSLEQQPDYRIEKNHGSFAKKRADRLNSFRLHSLVGGEWTSVDLEATNENFHFCQSFGDGQWLLVRGRAKGNVDQNAHVYGPNGRRLVSFHVGDGIEDVQATERDDIWVSYFDEGIFGDSDLGHSGLACFDPEGLPTFRFTALADPVVGSMADCYAFNAISSREVWLYYYTDFPLVKLVDNEISASWQMPVAGSHGFAVDGGRVLLGGSYSEKESLFLVALPKLEFQACRAVDDHGEPLAKFHVFGRRHHLYIQTEQALFLVDLKSIP